jgi:hypothetical protein
LPASICFATKQWYRWLGEKCQMQDAGAQQIHQQILSGPLGLSEDFIDADETMQGFLSTLKISFQNVSYPSGQHPLVNSTDIWRSPPMDLIPKTSKVVIMTEDSFNPIPVRFQTLHLSHP